MTSYGRKRSTRVSGADLDDALARVRRLAREQRVRIALAGGLAMQEYGSDRVTKDVDVLAARPLRGLGRGRRLTFGGTGHPQPNGVSIDVIVRDDDYADLYQHALVHARGGKVRPEHLISMKLVANRPKDESDLLFLLSHVDDRTFARALKIAARFLGRYAADELRSLRKEARWRRSSGLL